ncbi:MAG: RibD family protein [Succinivibrio sp.]
MDKPYIVLHMMQSYDGRIDCGMVGQISGSEYYDALDELDCGATVEGSVTARMHYAKDGRFKPSDPAPIGRVAFHKGRGHGKWRCTVDSKGTILWREGDCEGRISLLSEDAPLEYAKSLEAQGASWIAAGRGRVDLKAAMGILLREFGVRRVAVVGGGNVNGAFEDAGLFDEYSFMIAPGIDGRRGFAASVDGIDPKKGGRPHALALKSVKTCGKDVIWARLMPQ